MKKKEVFWGLLFILAAVLIIMNHFGFFEGIGMYEIVATVILSGIIIKSILNINFWGILFPLAVICIIFADQWNITDFTPWPALLSALLFSLGLSMIFKRPSLWVYHYHHHHHMHRSNIINEQDSNDINISTSFGASMKYVNSDNFEKANISCSFGDVKVYFDNVIISSGKADIYLDVSFGNAELYIPKTWKVINNVQVFLGDMGEKNRSDNSDSPVVTIHGNISFGNAKILYI